MKYNALSRGEKGKNVRSQSKRSRYLREREGFFIFTEFECFFFDEPDLELLLL